MLEIVKHAPAHFKFIQKVILAYFFLFQSFPQRIERYHRHHLIINFTCIFQTSIFPYLWEYGKIGLDAPPCIAQDVKAGAMETYVLLLL